MMSFDGLSTVHEIVMNRPNLIVLDWMMPDITGGEAIMRAQQAMLLDYPEMIRSINEKIPVVTFSAHPLSKLHRPDCPNFEYLDHWEKPLDFSTLTRRAVKLMNNL